MTQQHSSRRTIALTLVAILTVQLMSCGTLLHPERRGQSGGRVDPSIAVLDGIGLLFFIVPGLIAYAIDFSTGAIYLPRGHGNAPSDAENQLVVVQTEPGGPSNAELETILTEHTGREVDLSSGGMVSTPMENSEEFLPKYAQLVESGVLPSSAGDSSSLTP